MWSKIKTFLLLYLLCCLSINLFVMKGVLTLVFVTLAQRSLTSGSLVPEGVGLLSQKIIN